MSRSSLESILQQPIMSRSSPNRRNQFTRTEGMFEFVQRFGWTLLIRDFCSQIGVKKWFLKIWMLSKMKNSTTSTADILPECLIQKILCHLSYKEATKVSVLSKTWFQAWLTLPTLRFTSSKLKCKTKIVNSIMERYRDGKIPIEKFELIDFGYPREVFPLIDKWFDIALQNGVNDLVFGGPTFTLYPLPIFKILATTSLRELDLSFCNLKYVSVSSGVFANCQSLRKLSLAFVVLDENMLQILLNSCPLIVSFVLKCCSGLERIELLNLQRIKSVSISKARNQLVKIQASTLEHLSYYGDGLEVLDVVECHNLKSLDLSHVTISDEFLQYLISRSKFLKSMILVDVSYNSVERFDIFRDLQLHRKVAIRPGVTF